MENAKLAAHTYTSTATEDVQINIVPEGAFDFPEEPIGARLIVDIQDTLDLEVVPSTLIGGAATYKKIGSNVHLTEDQVKQMREEMRRHLQPAVVLAIGKGCSPWLTNSIQVGDTVRVFLNQIESDVEVEGKKYVIYPERCIISKIK